MRNLGQDTRWQEQALIALPTGVIVNHLGGEKACEWIIEVDNGVRGKPADDMVNIKANGGDMQYILRVQVYRF